MRSTTSRRSRHWTALALVASFLSVGTTARAQDGDAAIATELFNTGRDLMKQDKYAEACPKLAESARLAEKVGTLGKLAECEEKTGRIVNARAHFQQALNLARTTRDDRAPIVEQELARIEKIVPKLNLTATGAPPSGLDLEIDGAHVSAASIGVPLPVEPGSHTVAASAPGRRRWSSTVECKADGAVTNVTIPALAVDDAAPASATSAGGDGARDPGVETSSASPLGTIGLVTAGVGVVGLGIGTVFGLSASAKKSDAESSGCDGNRCTPEAATLRDDARSAGTLSTVFFVAGGLLAAGGITMWLLAPKATKTTAIHVAPSGGVSHAGLTIGGTW